LRSNPQWATLPVLAMTANAMSHDRDRCLEAGMNGHIAKPIDPDALFSSLLQWVRPRTMAPGDPVTQNPHPKALPVVATPEPASPLDALRRIEGLDVAAGLRRVLDKRPAYEGLLRKFVAGQASAVDTTRAALAAHQPDDAQRAMHTLKGTAGTIGATALAEMAHSVEQAIGQNASTSTIEALLEPVDTACQALIAALQTQLPPEEEPGTDGAAGASIHAAAAQQLLARLETLLADDDSDAVELFQDETPALKALLGPAFNDMKRALDSYDFVDALATLRTVRIAHPHNKEDPVHE